MSDITTELTELRARERMLHAISARTSAAELGRAIYPGFQSCFYFDVIASSFNACLRHVRGKSGGISRTCVGVPFQHGKTLLTELFVAQALGIDPSLKIISACYNVAYARERISGVQRLMNTPFYKATFPTRFGQASAINDDDTVRKSDKTQDKVRNTANMFQVRSVVNGKTEDMGGSFLSTSLSAGLNGRPYDIGIIDDPYRDEEMANSETERRHIEERYDTIFLSRQKQNSALVFTFTRMHPEDLIGYAIPRWKNSGVSHDVLRFPAIMDEDDAHRESYDIRPHGHGLSQALYDGGPEIKNAEFYRRMKAETQPWTWETCWQQRPTTRAGSFFDLGWWREYDPQDLREVDRYWVSIDCAAKAIGASWTCADLWAARGPQAFKIDELRGHWDVRQFERELMNWITDKWGREVRRQGSAILIEDGGFGRTIHDDLQAAGVDSLHLLGTGGLSKQARASMVLDFVRNGLAHLPSRSFGRVSSGWVEEHKTEYGRFPAPPCDRVDAGVQALRWHLDLLRGGD